MCSRTRRPSPRAIEAGDSVPRALGKARHAHVAFAAEFNHRVPHVDRDGLRLARARAPDFGGCQCACGDAALRDGPHAEGGRQCRLVPRQRHALKRRPVTAACRPNLGKGGACGHRLCSYAVSLVASHPDRTPQKGGNVLAEPDRLALALPLPSVSALTPRLVLIGGAWLARLAGFARRPVVLAAWRFMLAGLGPRRRCDPFAPDARAHARAGRHAIRSRPPAGVGRAPRRRGPYGALAPDHACGPVCCSHGARVRGAGRVRAAFC